jgi:hypothetical protein
MVRRIGLGEKKVLTRLSLNRWADSLLGSGSKSGAFDVTNRRYLLPVVKRLFPVKVMMLRPVKATVLWHLVIKMAPLNGLGQIVVV